MNKIRKVMVYGKMVPVSVKAIIEYPLFYTKS
jgi:hypothetical protein